MPATTVDLQIAFPSAFISYAHEDRALASWITVELQSIGVKVFLDEERLRLGDSLPSALEEAVASADVFVLVATADGLASQWTRREFQWAINRERRICAIYPTGVPDSSPWPELSDLLAVDAHKSLAPVIEGVVRAFAGCDGRATQIDLELARRNVDLQLGSELLRGVAAAIQRHVSTDTWLAAFSLENCFLWTASSGAPPLADTHVFVAPDSVNIRKTGQKEIPAGGKARVAVVRTSLAAVAQRLLQAATGSMLLPNESSSAAFARIKTRVDAMDHKRLFNSLSLVHDLLGNGSAEGMSLLLEHVQQQCVYGESPGATHREEFLSIFPATGPSPKQSLSVVVITYAENRAITACLESINRQTVRPSEVVVVEDTPYAEFDRLEARFRPDHHVCLPASTRGLARRARCRRVGTAIARSGLLLYVDGDTIIGPGVVEEVTAWWRERDESEGCLSLLVPDVEIQSPDSADEITYQSVVEALEGSTERWPWLSSLSGAGVLRSWHESATLTHSGRMELKDSLSWRNVRSRCWSVKRNDVVEVGNWDDAYEGWGTEETDLAYRLHLERGMRVRILSRIGAYAVHIVHSFDHEAQAKEHARNEALFIAKFPALTHERMTLAKRLGIAHLVQANLLGF